MSDDTTTAVRADRENRTDTPSLDHLERRRWQLWMVAAIVLVGTSASVITLLLGGPDRLGLPGPSVAVATVGVTVAFLLYAVDRERTFRRVTRTIFDQQERELDLVARLHDLKTLVRTSRSLNATLAADELYAVVLDGAMGITGAARGALFLRYGDDLAVAVSDGEGAPVRGHRIPVGHGDIGGIALEGDVALTGAAPSGVCAPIIIRGERVGVLAVERDRSDEGFTDRDVTLVRLFAEQAAIAVDNATRFERERSRVESLVDAGEQRSEVVARMVHDLRAPLSAISGYGQLIRDRGDRLSGDQRAQAVDGVLEQSDRMRRMIDEVLSAAAVEAGAELRREPVDLAAVLEEASATGRAVAQAQGQERVIEVESSEDAGLVQADPEALRHVFANLVDNALKYSPAASPVVLRAEDRGDRVLVHVIDRGVGIATDDLSHVFERFRQVDGRRTGVGLGLYIVRTLVRAHAGDVSVRSKEGVGTAFTVALPRQPAA